jgi:hypothetical protein
MHCYREWEEDGEWKDAEHDFTVRVRLNLSMEHLPKE